MPESGQRNRRRELGLALLVIAVAVAVVLAVPQMRHSFSLALHGNFGGLRAYVRSLGAGGFALLLALMLTHAVIYYPTELVTATAGFVYGFLPALAFVTAGWLASALLSYVIGMSVGRPLLRRLLGPRFHRLEEGMASGGRLLLLSGRLIPVMPFSLLGYAAGATRVNLWRFAWTTVVGYLPLLVAITYLGSQAKTFSASNPFLWIAAAVLLGLLVTAHIESRRRRRTAERD
jgi:uncharacterized membrane protein YdjX (TVP38/TMEM64 family)